MTLNYMFGIITSFLFGTCVGSFLNVVIDRIPKGESIVRGRSHCDYCKKTLGWYELIPVLSWIIQLGSCRSCRRKLSVQYPVVECIIGIGFAYLFTLFYQNPFAFLMALFIFCFLAVTCIADYKYELISDQIILLTLGSTILFHLTVHGLGSIPSYLVSGLGAMMPFILIWSFSKGRAMGFGDVELSFALGFMAGFPDILYGLSVAFLTGALAGVILMIGAKKTLKSHIAFGPFLIVGTGIGIMYSGQIELLLKGFIW